MVSEVFRSMNRMVYDSHSSQVQNEGKPLFLSILVAKNNSEMNFLASPYNFFIQ